MKVIKPRVEIEEALDPVRMMRLIERCARVCYQSEGKTTPTSYIDMIAKVIKMGHESTLEHEKVTVFIICDRGVTHEIVRHRIGAYSQESTRYCNYRTSIKFIKPFFFAGNKKKFEDWKKAMLACEKAYNNLIDKGSSPQEARSVLPNSLKTQIAVTYDMREWRHFFKLRTARAAHPQMREITVPLLKQFKKLFPVIFTDITPYEG